MLQISFIRENKTLVVERLAKRYFEDSGLVEEAIEADEMRRKIKFELDNSLSEANKAAKQIGQLFASGKKSEAEALRAQVGSMKTRAKDLEERLRQADCQLEEILLKIPNIPHDLVVKGRTPEDNEIIRSGGKIPKLPDDAKPHWELGNEYDFLDFTMGVKLTGSGFPVYKGKGAKLQRALITYFLEQAVKAGYTEIIPPLMVNQDSAYATGQLPDKEGQMYHVQADDLYLIPTAEVPITNILRDTILQAKDFPVKMAGYTPCFRREAGSYGKDVRGLNRVHQFDKVEIVQAQHPEKSYQTLEEMVTHVEQLVKSLELPYRIVRLCGGDMGFTSAMTYDFEVYAAAQRKWLEVSSVSNFESFQANRLKLRFKNAAGKTELAHTLNGSALALPRIVAALLENNQNTEGITIPKVLVPYTGFEKIEKG